MTAYVWPGTRRPDGWISGPRHLFAQRPDLVVDIIAGKLGRPVDHDVELYALDPLPQDLRTNTVRIGYGDLTRCGAPRPGTGEPCIRPGRCRRGDYHQVDRPRTGPTYKATDVLIWKETRW